MWSFHRCKIYLNKLYAILSHAQHLIRIPIQSNTSLLEEIKMRMTDGPFSGEKVLFLWDSTWLARVIYIGRRVITHEHCIRQSACPFSPTHDTQRIVRAPRALINIQWLFLARGPSDVGRARFFSYVEERKAYRVPSIICTLALCNSIKKHEWRLL